MSGLIHSKGFKVIFIIIFIFLFYKFYINYRQIQDLENRIVKLEDSINLAKEEKNKLKTELENINNPKYIEKIAREELGLVKPGELLLIPVEEENNNK